MLLNFHTSLFNINLNQQRRKTDSEQLGPRLKIHIYFITSELVLSWIELVT